MTSAWSSAGMSSITWDGIDNDICRFRTYISQGTLAPRFSGYSTSVYSAAFLPNQTG